VLYASNVVLWPAIATLAPFRSGAPEESVQTLPCASTICAAEGIMVPLADGEAAASLLTADALATAEEASSSPHPATTRYERRSAALRMME
jgi:hypothetical protein